MAAITAMHRPLLTLRGRCNPRLVTPAARTHIVRRVIDPQQEGSAPPLAADEQQASNSTAQSSTSSTSNSLPSAASSREDQPLGVPYALVAGLAGVGVAETAYLWASKLAGGDVACPTRGCASVLSSPFAQLFGVPLPLWGLLAYGGVAAVALAAGRQAGSGGAPPRGLNTVLLAGCGVLASVSATLMYVLHTALDGAPCVYCYTSAAISFVLLVSMLTCLDRRNLADAAGPGLASVAATCLALYLGYAPALAQASGDFELPYAPPAVTNDSNGRALALASRLRDAGARMYGAFWCSHCFDQKQLFGRQAMAAFPYVECYPDGWKRGVPISQACDAAGVKAFPTWVINGVATEGELDFDQLEAALADSEQAGQQAAMAAAAAATQ